MRLSFLLISLCALGVSLISCGGSGSATTSRDTKTTYAATTYKTVDKSASEAVPMRGLSEIPFEFSWDLQLPAAVHKTWIQPEIPNVLFVQTLKKQIHAIDIGSGYTLWVTRALPKLVELAPDIVREELPGRKKGTVVLDDRLYVISDSVLFCIDAQYGQIIWRFALPFEPSTGPYATGSGKGLRIFIGDWQGHLRVVTYHLAEKKRPLVDSRDRVISNVKGNPYVLWQWNLRGAPMAEPIGTGGLAYIANDRGVLDCFDHDRELKWSYKMGHSMLGEPIYRGRSLYFGTIDNVFHVVNRLSGQVMGQLYLDAPIERSPFTFSYDGRRVYAWTSGKGKEQGLYAIDAIPDTIAYKDSVDDLFPLEVERLKVAWFVPGMTHVVAATKKHLFTTYPNDSTVYAINRSSGKMEWSWDVGMSEDGKHNRDVSLCEYVDYAGKNQSVISYDRTGKIVAYKLFGQL